MPETQNHWYWEICAEIPLKSWLLALVQIEMQPKHGQIDWCEVRWNKTAWLRTSAGTDVLSSIGCRWVGLTERTLDKALVILMSCKTWNLVKPGETWWNLMKPDVSWMEEETLRLSARTRPGRPDLEWNAHRVRTTEHSQSSTAFVRSKWFEMSRSIFKQHNHNRIEGSSPNNTSQNTLNNMKWCRGMLEKESWIKWLPSRFQHLITEPQESTVHTFGSNESWRAFVGFLSNPPVMHGLTLHMSSEPAMSIKYIYIYRILLHIIAI